MTKYKKECSSFKEFMESYVEINEHFFTKILCEFHVCLVCGYTLWEGHCPACAPVEITLPKIMHRDKPSLNVGKKFFISRT